MKKTYKTSLSKSMKQQIPSKIPYKFLLSFLKFLLFWAWKEFQKEKKDSGNPASNIIKQAQIHNARETDQECYKGNKINLI